MVSYDLVQEEAARLLYLSKNYLALLPPALTVLLASFRDRLPRKVPFHLLPQNPRRLALLAAASLASVFVILMLWNGLHESDPSLSRSRIEDEIDESFPAIQSPPKKEHHEDDKQQKGKGNDKNKEKGSDKGKGKGKGVVEGKEKEEKPHSKPLPKFWSVYDGGTGRGETNTTKPRGVNKIMGLVFYGRRSTASILDCYLKRNLVKNGGMLDSIIWVQHTTNPLDLVFLDKLIHSEPDYRRLYADDLALSGSPNRATGYDYIENDVTYVKIDDDIVFMEDTVIPTLIHTRYSRKHKQLSLVSANIVGPSSPSMNWIHWSLGAIQPFLPELTNDFPIDLGRRVNWRPSSLPTWIGPREFNATSWTSPGNLPHRWLPLRGDAASRYMNQTPIASARYDKRQPSFVPLSGNVTHTPMMRRHNNTQQQWATRGSPPSSSPSSSTWQMAAQAHYSLLDALETNDLGRYRFGLWDFHESASPLAGLHLAAMTGSDINAVKPISSDDARHFSVTMPRKTGRRAVAAGEAVAAHYSSKGYLGRHRAQDGGLDSTDLLDRYRAFARENICAGGDLLWSSVGDDPAVPWGG